MNVEDCLASVEAALEDAEASLSTDLGDQRERTLARVWRGQVLVDWEADSQAGGCLLRPALLRRLLALHAEVTPTVDALTLKAPGRILAALTPDHATLVRQLGGARRVELVANLRFKNGQYGGGDETYYLVEGGKRSAGLMRLVAEVRIRSDHAASPRTSLAAR
jgi:hypothetical protein